MKKPFKGNSTKFTWHVIALPRGFDEKVKKSYWFLITNDVIEGSRDKNYVDQTALVSQKTRSECELPKILEALACCSMHRVSSGKYLVEREPRIYMRCQVQMGYLLNVEGFTSGRIGIDYSILNDFSSNCGVAASRKFC